MPSDPETLPTAEADAPPVQRIGSYRVEGRLGAARAVGSAAATGTLGAAGEVLLAYDERLGRPVTIRRVDCAGARGEEERRRIRRAARAAAALHHPALAQVYDLVTDGDSEAVILERIEGRPLRALVAAGRCEPALAVRLAREIAEALAQAHAAGVAGFDLDAERVLVTPSGHAKLLDLGMAAAGELEDEAARPGSAGSLGDAPTGSLWPTGGCTPEPDRTRGDLAALGGLLHEMLDGRQLARCGLAALARDLGDPGDLGDLRYGRLRAEQSTAAEVARTLARIEVQGLAVRRRADARRRLVRGAVLAAAGAAGALAAVRYLAFSSPTTLRIVVPSPRVQPAGDENAALLGSGALVAALSTLASLTGVVPLEPAQAGAALAPVEAARTAAADEVLTIAVDGEGEAGATVRLRRVRGGDGRVLWSSSFHIPSDPRYVHLLAEAVGSRLRQAFPGRRLRRGTPDLAVREEDYAAFLQVARRIDAGQVDAKAELARLAAICRGSPRFLSAHLLAASVAETVFRSTRDPAYLEQARHAAEAARRLAPEDARPLVARFRIALASGRLEQARSILAELERLAPGDPETLVLGARLDRREGATRRALEALRVACRRAPSWRNLFELADLEHQSGQSAAARGHLEALLARGPHNIWGLDKLGSIELLVGDLHRAEAIYLDLIRLHPEPSYFNNLGLARTFLGENADAVRAYARALELEPGDVSAMLNLADADLAAGDEAAARSLYAQVLARLRRNAAAAALEPGDRMIEAQCLAHLGRRREAVEVTRQVLLQSSTNPDVLYTAALVFACTGDRASALVNARLALERGVQPRWFALAAFGPLRSDPELRRLAAGAAAAGRRAAAPQIAR